MGWLRSVARIKVTRENDIAEALRMMGGTRKRGCPISGVGDNADNSGLKVLEQITMPLF